MEASRSGGGDAREVSPRKTSSSSSTSAGRWWWRCINAARWVVALALTVLIVVVIAYAIKVVFREKQLVITVQDGLVAVKPPARRGEAITFVLTVEAFNPSGQGRISFTGVMAYLAANNRSDMPQIFIKFNLDAMNVLPQSYTVWDAEVDAGIGFSGGDASLGDPGHRFYYDEFSNGTIITNAALRLTGLLQTESYLGYKTDDRAVVYCCSAITIGPVTDAAAGSTNRLCTEQKLSIEQQPEATLLSCVPVSL